MGKGDALILPREFEAVQHALAYSPALLYWRTFQELGNLFLNVRRSFEH
jgi:hypothetical protein